MNYDFLTVLSVAISILILIVFLVMANNVRKILDLLRQNARERKAKESSNNDLSKTVRDVSNRGTSVEQTSVNDPENFDKIIEKFSSK